MESSRWHPPLTGGGWPCLGDVLSEEVYGGQPKLALGWVDDQSVLAELFKESPKVGHVFRSGCAGDEDIIKVDKDERQVSQH